MTTSTRLLISSALVSAATLFMATPALADCALDSTGTIVTCTSTSTGFSATTPGTKITVSSGASVTGTGLSASGVGSSVYNIGTINTGAGVTAINLNGGNGTVTQDAAATGAITGNIIFGPSGAGQVNTLVNNNTSTTLGIAGNITSTGNTIVTNFGTISGSITEQTTTGVPTVTITNAAAATITGSISTADATTINNSGTITGGISTLAPLNLTNSGTITGNISTTAATIPQGNLTINNTGTITGNITETPGSVLGSVTLTNGAAGATYTSTTTPTITGVLGLGDPSTVVNYGIMNVTGSVNGNVTNNGTLGSGTASAPGSLAITGNYTQSAAGTYTAYFTPTAGGTIQLTGQASLAGTINLQPSTGYYPTGKTYNVVVANGGITGGFSAVTTTLVTTAATSTTAAVTTTTSGSALSPFLSFVNNGIVAGTNGQQFYQFVVSRTPYDTALASVGTANQLAVARGFQGLVAAADTATNTTPLTNAADAATLVGGVDFLTVAQAQTFFDQISPAGYGAYVGVLQDQGILFNRQVSQRLNTLALDNISTGPWITPYYQRGTSNNAYGSSEDVIGVALGYDAGGEHKRGGVTIGYSNATSNYKPGGLTGHSNAFAVGVYGGISAKKLTADIQLDYINGSIGTTKTLTIGTAIRTDNASPSANIFKAVGNLGVNLGNDTSKIKPFIGFDYSKGKISSFTETNGLAADLTVNSIKTDRADVVIGFDYARQTGGIRPYLHAAYRYNLMTPQSQITAFFANDPSTTSFTVSTLAPSRSQEDVNAGVRFAADDDGSYLFLGYQGTFRGDLMSHGVNAGLFVAF